MLIVEKPLHYFITYDCIYNVTYMLIHYQCLKGDSIKAVWYIWYIFFLNNNIYKLEICQMFTSIKYTKFEIFFWSIFVFTFQFLSPMRHLSLYWLEEQQNNSLLYWREFRNAIIQALQWETKQSWKYESFVVLLGFF